MFTERNKRFPPTECSFILSKFPQYFMNVEIETVLGACDLCRFNTEKGIDLTQSYDINPYAHRNSQKQRDNTTTPPKTSITQRLLTDLGRSVGV